MDDALRQLVAADQIAKVKARYFRLMDTRQWERFGELFTADATIDFPDQRDVELSEDGALSGPCQGRELIVETLSKGLVGVVSVHQGQMAEIEITSERTATAIWSMEDRLWFPPDAGWRVREAHGYGHYQETYELDEGQWRIKTLVLSRLQLVTVPW